MTLAVTRAVRDTREYNGATTRGIKAMDLILAMAALVGFSEVSPANQDNTGGAYIEASPPAALNRVIYHHEIEAGAGSYGLSDRHEYVAGRFHTSDIRDPHELTSVGWYGYLGDAATLDVYVAPSTPDGPGTAVRLGSYDDSNTGFADWHVLDRLAPYVVDPGRSYFLIVHVASGGLANYWWTSYQVGNPPWAAYGSNDLENWVPAIHTTPESGRLCAMDVQGVEAITSGLDVFVYDAPDCVNTPMGVTYGVTVVNVGDTETSFDAVRVEATGPMPDPYVEVLLERHVVLGPHESVFGTVRVVAPRVAPEGAYTVGTVVSLEGADVGSASFESVIQSEPCE